LRLIWSHGKRFAHLPAGSGGHIFVEMLYPKPPPKHLIHPRCMKCHGKGWAPRHGGLRKRVCEFCNGRGVKIPKPLLAKLTGRR
jgi:hypothetical protein